MEGPLLLHSLLNSSGGRKKWNGKKKYQTKEKEDLISALLNMGFKRKEVDKIVDATIREFKQDAGFEILLRESLKQLSKI